jgi:hypothetical protein
VKRIAALLTPALVLCFLAPVLAAAGVFVLAGIGWGLLAAGGAAFVLEWRLTS